MAREHTHVGLVSIRVGDVAVLDGEHLSFLPSVRGLGETVYDGTYALGMEFAFLVLPAFLKQAGHQGIVRPGHLTVLAQSRHLEALLFSRQLHVVVELQCLGAFVERHAQGNLAPGILAGGDGFNGLACIDTSGCYHLDVYHAHGLAAFYLGDQSGALAVAVCVGEHRGVRLDDAHHLGIHVARGPGRATLVMVRLRLVEGGRGADFHDRFRLSSNHTALLDVTGNPLFEVPVLDGLFFLCAYIYCGS